MTRSGDDTPTIAGEVHVSARGPRPWISRRWEWCVLGILLVAYSGLLTYFGYLRSVDFYTANWDLGINQQLLWTTSHGRLLYETSDLSFYNAHSYLQVHSTYIAFAISPLYAAASSPLTLFALESSVFAASAVPLYLFAREVVRRPGLRFAAVALYLASFGVISGLTFDFHWEAFLPVELLTFFLLVRRERFVLSLIPFAIGTLTLEVFPFLVGGVLLFFLYERAASFRWQWTRIRQDRHVRLLAGFLILGLAAYLTVRLFQYDVVPVVLGVPSSTGGTTGGLATGALGWGANGITLPHSIAYWLLLLATFAFLPLLAPRYLILSLPWFVYSVFISPWFSHYFGMPYALIAASTLAVASVAGLSEVERHESPRTLTVPLFAAFAGLAVVFTAIAWAPGESSGFLGYSSGAAFWGPALLLFGIAIALSFATYGALRPRRVLNAEDEPRRAGRRGARNRAVLPLLGIIFVSVLVLDAALSPMNTANFDATPVPGYLFSWGENPMSQQMSWFTGQIPAGAEVLASNHLFPYVANDPNAWAVPWFVIGPTNPVPFFPFTPAVLPKYVLADASEMQWMPSFLASDLFNTSVYGLVAYAYMASYPGTVYLFELGYAGATQERVVGTPPQELLFGWTNLSVGPAGQLARDSSSVFGRVITSESSGAEGAADTAVWSGPDVPLRPGTYAITFNVTGGPVPGTNSSTPFAELNVTWTGGTAEHPLIESPVSGSDLHGGGWTSLSYAIRLTAPYPLVEFQGSLALSAGRSLGFITLNYVEVQFTGS